MYYCCIIIEKSAKVHNYTLSKPQSPLFDHTVPGELRDYFVHILCSGLPRYKVSLYSFYANIAESCDSAMLF